MGGTLIISAFEEANDIKVPYVIVDRRSGDIAECYADVTKAEQELSWTAKRGIVEMCRDAWRFEKSHEIEESVVEVAASQD